MIPNAAQMLLDDPRDRQMADAPSCCHMVPDIPGRMPPTDPGCCHTLADATNPNNNAKTNPNTSFFRNAYADHNSRTNATLRNHQGPRQPHSPSPRQPQAPQCAAAVEGRGGGQRPSHGTNGNTCGARHGTTRHSRRSHGITVVFVAVATIEIGGAPAAMAATASVG